MKQTPLNPQFWSSPASQIAGFCFSPKENTLINGHERTTRGLGLARCLPLIRTIAVTLVILMLAQDLSWANPDMGRTFAPVVAGGPMVVIPRDMGRVEDGFGSASLESDEPLLVNIRDAHRKLDSQYSISRLLEHLADKYQLGFVSMEGAAGPVHTGLLASFPDTESRDRMADGLLKQGRLSASEYFAITSNREIKLYGAENGALYKRDRTLFAKILELSTAARSLASRMEKRADRDAARLLSADARAFRDARAGFRRRKIPLDRYVDKLQETARNAGDAGLIGRHEQASRYLRLLHTEKNLRFEKIDLERKALLAVLRRIDPALASNLARITAEYVSKKTGHAEFAREVWRIAHARGIRAADYPAFRLYARYWAEFGRLDLYGVWSDLELIEKQLEHLTADSEAAKGFFAKEAERALLSKLVTLGLTSEEYRSIRKNPGLRKPAQMLRASERQAVRAALAFYAVAERRNHYLLKNTLQRMKREGVKVGALVTGGFHSEGLSELMRSDRVSHLIVMPAFDPESGDRPYVTVLTQRPAEWEKRLTGDDFYLAAPAWIGRGPATLAEAEPLMAELLAGRRAQGKPDFTDQEVSAYVAAYTAARRADSAANPLSPEALRQLLGSAGGIRRATPTRVDVTLGARVWHVTVDAVTGQPIASAPASERMIDAAPKPAELPGFEASAVVELLTPAEARPVHTGRRDTAFESVIPVRPPAAGKAAPAPNKFRSTSADVEIGDIAGWNPDAEPVLAAARLSVTTAQWLEAAFLSAAVLTPGLGWVLPAWIGIRTLNLTAFLTHGSGHKLAEWMVRPADQRIVSAREGVSWKQLLLSVFPLMPLPQSLAEPTNLMASDSSANENDKPGWRERWIAAGGQIASLGTLLFAAVSFWLTQSSDPAAPMTVAQILSLGLAGAAALTAASLPDWRTLLGKTGAIACGPFFIIRTRNKEERSRSRRDERRAIKSGESLISPRMRGLFRIVAGYAAARGGQSAGFSIEIQKNGMPVITFEKMVKGKRQRIVQELQREMDLFAKRMAKKGFEPRDTYEVLLAHMRYATGGRTNWHNAQPHWHEDPAWVEKYDLATDASGRPIIDRSYVIAANMVGHNGDKDASRIELKFAEEDGTQFEAARVDLREGKTWDTREIAQGDIRKFFKAAMPVSTSEGNSDSKTVAEWTDFHMTRGVLSKALRFSWFSTVPDASAIISGNTEGLPDAEQWQRWSEEVSDEVSQLLRRPGILSQNGQTLSDVNQETRTAFRAILKKRFANRVSADDLARFVELSERAFFDQGMEWCMRRIASTFIGTFALMVYTTLEPRIGVFALTQAFSIGVNHTRGEVIGSAEPMGVITTLAAGDPDDKTEQVMLRHGQYAVIEMDLAAQPTIRDAVRIYDTQTAYDEESRPTTLANNPWFPVNGNEKIDIPEPPSTDASFDELGDNLMDIPSVIERVRLSVLDGGRNEESMQHLRALIRKKALAWNRGDRTEAYDIILHGVDYNEEEAREIVRIIHEAAPFLGIRAMNSGTLIRVLKREADRKKEGLQSQLIDSSTIFIGLSNSAQTQSAREANRLAWEYQGSKPATVQNPGNIIVVSQQLFNSMSGDLGQGYQPEDPLLPITFQTLSHFTRDGRTRTRWNEAATVEPLAMHALMTELLVAVISEVLAVSQETSIPAFGLQEEIDMADVEGFRDFQRVSYQEEMPERLGTVDRYPSDRPDYEKPLEAEAVYRAGNITEWLDAYTAFAAYVLASSAKGKFALFSLAAAIMGFSLSAPAVGLFIGLMNGAFALFFVWLAIVAIRWGHNKPLLARTGTRLMVFIDEEYVANILDRYTKTLFSLAPGFLTMLTWATSVVEALHRYGMVSHRGVMTSNRMTDPGLGEEAAKEAKEAKMVAAQLGGIEVNGGQPEVHMTVRASTALSGYRPLAEKGPEVVQLTNHMTDLMRQYDGKLSRHALAWVKDRLLTASDGIVSEMWINYRTAVLVSTWAERKLVKLLGKRLGVWTARRLKATWIFLIGLTFNEAKVQSTAHPVDAQKSGISTMQYRHTRYGYNQKPEGAADTETEYEIRVVSNHLRLIVADHLGVPMDINLRPVDGSPNTYESVRLGDTVWTAIFDPSQSSFAVFKNNFEVTSISFSPLMGESATEEPGAGTPSVSAARLSATQQLRRVLFAALAYAQIPAGLSAWLAGRNAEMLIGWLQANTGLPDKVLTGGQQLLISSKVMLTAEVYAAVVVTAVTVAALGWVVWKVLKGIVFVIKKIVVRRKSFAPEPYPAMPKKFKARYLIEQGRRNKRPSPQSPQALPGSARKVPPPTAENPFPTPPRQGPRALPSTGIPAPSATPQRTLAEVDTTRTSEKWTARILLSGRIRLTEDKPNGLSVTLAPGAGSVFAGASANGTVYSAALTPSPDTKLIIKQGDTEVSRIDLNTAEYQSIQRIVKGARLAVSGNMQDAPKIGVLISHAGQRRDWMSAWQEWTGRAADSDRFIFWVAGERGRAADAEDLRAAGAWWVVDASDGIESLPDWMRAMEISGTGSEALLEQVMSKMLNAPIPGLWSLEDWERLAEAAEQAMPDAAPARLMRDGNGLAINISAPTGQDAAATAAALLKDVDARLAEALISRESALNPQALTDLAGEWLEVIDAARSAVHQNGGSLKSAEPAVMRTPFAAVDPSHQLSSALKDQALMVTDLEIFAKDGGLPYRMRVERAERIAKGALTSALLVRNPELRSREAVLAAYPDAEIFGDRMIFAASADAADQIQAAAAEWGLANRPIAWITDEQQMRGPDIDQEETLWTVALANNAETTIGILETALQLLNNPGGSQNGLNKVASRSFIYRWPKALPADYVRLVETLRATRTSA